MTVTKTPPPNSKGGTPAEAASKTGKWRFPSLPSGLTDLTVRLLDWIETRCPRQLFQRLMCWPLLAYVAVHVIEWMHRIEPLPIEEPTFIYLAMAGLISMCFWGMTVPTLFIAVLAYGLRRRRARSVHNDVGYQACKQYHQFRNRFCKATTIYENPAYKFGEEFVLRETGSGWQLYMTAFRFTAADEKMRKKILQLVRLTDPDRFFACPKQAIGEWLAGFRPYATYVSGMKYQIAGCGFSLRYVLRNFHFVGVTLEFQDGRREYLEPLNQFG